MYSEAKEEITFSKRLIQNQQPKTTKKLPKKNKKTTQKKTFFKLIMNMLYVHLQCITLNK